MEWETQHSKSVISSQNTPRLNTKPIKPSRIFFFGGAGRVDLDKPTLKFIQKVKGTRTAKTTLKKHEIREVTLADFNLPQGHQ